MATDGLIILVNPVLVIEVSGIIYSVVVGISWVTCPYFEGLVFFFSGILILLVVIVFLNMAFGDSVLGGVVPFLRSGVEDKYISCDITDIYRFDFLIGIFLNKVPLLSIL